VEVQEWEPPHVTGENMMRIIDENMEAGVSPKECFERGRGGGRFRGLLAFSRVQEAVVKPTGGAQEGRVVLNERTPSVSMLLQHLGLLRLRRTSGEEV
jgi:hypothetical protein